MYPISEPLWPGNGICTSGDIFPIAGAQTTLAIESTTPAPAEKVTLRETIALLIFFLIKFDSEYFITKEVSQPTLLQTEAS